MSTCGAARLASTPTGEGHMSMSDEERARRADDAARIRHSTELEGGRTSEAARAIQDQYVRGEIDAQELMRRTFALDSDDDGVRP